MADDTYSANTSIVGSTADSAEIETRICSKCGSPIPKNSYECDYCHSHYDNKTVQEFICKNCGKPVNNPENNYQCEDRNCKTVNSQYCIVGGATPIVVIAKPIIVRKNGESQKVPIAIGRVFADSEYRPELQELNYVDNGLDETDDDYYQYAVGRCFRYSKIRIELALPSGYKVWYTHVSFRNTYNGSDINSYEIYDEINKSDQIIEINNCPGSPYPICKENQILYIQVMVIPDESEEDDGVIKFSVTPNNSNWGTVSMMKEDKEFDGTCIYGDNFQIQAHPFKNYKFIGWAYEKHIHNDSSSSGDKEWIGDDFENPILTINIIDMIDHSEKDGDITYVKVKAIFEEMSNTEKEDQQQEIIDGSLDTNDKICHYLSTWSAAKHLINLYYPNSEFDQNLKEDDLVVISPVSENNIKLTFIGKTSNIIKSINNYQNSIDLYKTTYDSYTNSIEWCKTYTVNSIEDISLIVNNYNDIFSDKSDNYTLLGEKWCGLTRYNNPMDNPIKWINLLTSENFTNLYSSYAEKYNINILETEETNSGNKVIKLGYILFDDVNAGMFISNNPERLMFANIKTYLTNLNKETAKSKSFNGSSSVLDNIFYWMDSVQYPSKYDIPSLGYYNILGPNLYCTEMNHNILPNRSEYLYRYSGHIKPTFVEPKKNNIYIKKVVNQDESPDLYNDPDLNYSLSYPSIKYYPWDAIESAEKYTESEYKLPYEYKNTINNKSILLKPELVLEFNNVYANKVKNKVSGKDTGEVESYSYSSCSYKTIKDLILSKLAQEYNYNTIDNILYYIYDRYDINIDYEYASLTNINAYNYTIKMILK